MRVAVVIPCYKVKNFVLDVINAIGPEVDCIFAVDDCCPDGSADYIEKNCVDDRVQIVRNSINLGVGGAVMAGYRAALDAGMDIVVKVDGDGQMDPSLIPLFISPIAAGEADYAKGNRFFSASAVRSMPRQRLFGNAALSFMTKLSSGYWSVFDPTNGYTAIHNRALASIDLRTLSERYFFETDMLIRLGDLRAVVIDVPMRAVYGDEVSGLRVREIFKEFLTKHVKATIRRITYLYLLRDFNIASLNLVMGALFMIFGLIFGSIEWINSVRTGVTASTGTVMLAVLPIIAGLQMLLFFLGYDISAEPKRPVQHQSVLSALDQETVKTADIDEKTREISSV
ncbi:Glycosyltransferase, GT2 family [Ruegeria halocynthiae]|uniref:Glycosyltransferase, GT2 family n=1 Tax=Ruegeria halocynthiae TaxID=985054 RepID=A0A1H3E2Q2_9RHOB|nr:glycosyltransferase family 2 protein [Ruegeria halocynthiae]SDX72568.1 Glycosyltransferase, GT2 family [Ruegeria halocynthiae]